MMRHGPLLSHAGQPRLTRRPQQRLPRVLVLLLLLCAGSVHGGGTGKGRPRVAAHDPQHSAQPGGALRPHPQQQLPYALGGARGGAAFGSQLLSWLRRQQHAARAASAGEQSDGADGGRAGGALERRRDTQRHARFLSDSAVLAVAPAPDDALLGGPMPGSELPVSADDPPAPAAAPISAPGPPPPGGPPPPPAPPPPYAGPPPPLAAAPSPGLAPEPAPAALPGPDSMPIGSPSGIAGGGGPAAQPAAAPEPSLINNGAPVPLPLPATDAPGPQPAAATAPAPGRPLTGGTAGDGPAAGPAEAPGPSSSAPGGGGSSRQMDAGGPAPLTEFLPAPAPAPAPIPFVDPPVPSPAPMDVAPAPTVAPTPTPVPMVYVAPVPAPDPVPIAPAAGYSPTPVPAQQEVFPGPAVSPGHDDDGTRGNHEAAPATTPYTAPPFAAVAPAVGVAFTNGAVGTPSDGSAFVTPAPAPADPPTAPGPNSPITVLLGGPPAPSNATNTLSGCSLPVCPAPKVQPAACGAVWQVQPTDTCAKNLVSPLPGNGCTFDACRSGEVVPSTDT